MNKNTGISRKVDKLGRVVIPIEVRKKYEINEGDEMDIFIDKDGTISFKKVEVCCTFCGNPKTLLEQNNKLVCYDCMNKMVGKFMKQ